MDVLLANSCYLIMTNKTKTPVLITAIICVALLEAWALYLGHDGLILTSVIGAICLLAGNVMPTVKVLQ